jgi:hypothetical protein
MATLKGLGVFWGLEGVTYTGFGTVTAQTQSADLNVTADEKQIRDADGDVISVVYYNQTRTLDLEVVPTGATIALAQASSAAFMVNSGNIITVTDTQAGLEIDSAEGSGAAGVYILKESRLSRSNENEARISMSLFRSDVNNIGTTVAD